MSVIRATLCLDSQLAIHEAVAPELSVEGPNNRWQKRLEIQYTRLLNRCGTQIPVTAQEFLILASAIAALDAHVPQPVVLQHGTRDRPREFALTMPVWTRQLLSAAPALEQWVGSVTGDRWHFRFVLESPQDPMHCGQRLLKPNAYRPACTGSLDAVALFSGELDAVTAVVNWLEQHRHARLLLICHYDGRIPGALFAQRYLLQQLQRIYPERLETILLRVDSPDPRPDPSRLFRSRPILLFAWALQAFGSLMLPGQSLFIPEGGEYRLGGSSPYTLSTQAFALLDCCVERLPALLLQPVSANNPFYGVTTGEALAACRHRDIVEQLVPFIGVCVTEQPRAMRSSTQVSYCDRCLPCLSRLAALHAAGWERPHQEAVSTIRLPQPLRRSPVWSDRAMQECVALARSAPSIEALEQRLIRMGGRPRSYPTHCLRSDAAVLSRALGEIRAVLPDAVLDRPSDECRFDARRERPAHHGRAPDSAQVAHSWVRPTETLAIH